MITYNNNMIIDFNVNFKTYEDKILNNYGFLYYECPKCGARHSLIRHGVYERNISFFSEGSICNEKMKILRLKCTSCESTHAILQNDVVPYCIYSYSFMMKIVIDIFVNGESVLSLANKHNISFQLIYSFILKINKFLKDCVYVLKALNLLKNISNPSVKHILSEINDCSLRSLINIYQVNISILFILL